MRKKSLLLSALIAAVLLPISINAQWSLVWQDEFNGSISNAWTYDIGMGQSGWGNNEKQYYRRENASVVNGMLQIQARVENYGGASYTSARLKTQGLKTFKYGKIEARISMPAFSGVWPAFWMLGKNITSVSWPACGEIDIMEHVNTENKVYGTSHWDYNGYASYGGNTTTDVTKFHVYGIEWDEEYIRWFLDGKQYHEIFIGGGINGTDELHNECFLLLNMAIGGQWPGFNIDNSAMPANMLVDYVRVYKKSGDDDTPQNTITIEAEDYSDMSGVHRENCAEGGLNVGYIETGDWMAYNNINFPSTGTYTVQYRVASINGGRLSLDLNAGSIVLGTADIPATGGWQNWTTITQTVTVNAGTYNLGIYAATGGWNINWLKITEGTLKSSSPEITKTQDASPEVYAYPIPAENHIFVSGIEEGCDVQIIDIQGKELISTHVGSPSDGINISQLNKGVFFLKIRNKGNTEIIRFVK